LRSRATKHGQQTVKLRNEERQRIHVTFVQKSRVSFKSTPEFGRCK